MVQDALTRAGFENVHVVAEQFEPDGDFPTVAFPNPEEDGALDLALALAEEVGADVILANDPDADRLACCARGADGMVQLTGNELGVVLGHYLLTEGPQTGERLVLNSVVSSPQLGGIATKLGARWTETLTGFKWIANTAMSQEAAQPGARFVFGYEEALGYCVGSLVRDKDGISAAVALCELAASLKAKGETLLDRLAAIAREYGVYTSRQRSTVFPGASGAERMQEIMAGLRRTPPLTIGALSVVATTDFQEGVRKAGGEETKLDFPPSDVMAFELEGGSRVIARPSGTEPKIKFYVDVCVTLGEGESLEATRERAETLAGELDEAFAQATGVLDAS